MTGRWGVVDGGVQPGGRWNGEVPVEEEGALVGERDRLVGEMWSLAMARCKTISIQVNAERHSKNSWLQMYNKGSKGSNLSSM